MIAIENRCPACGPVEAEMSSRYCAEHLRELLGRCLEVPAKAPAHLTDPMDWLEDALVGAHAA